MIKISYLIAAETCHRAQDYLPENFFFSWSSRAAPSHKGMKKSFPGEDKVLRYRKLCSGRGDGGTGIDKFALKRGLFELKQGILIRANKILK